MPIGSTPPGVTESNTLTPLQPSYSSMYHVAGTNDQGQELRKFNDAAIQAQIDRAIAQARLKEDGKHAAIIAYATSSGATQQLSLAAMFRVDGPWGSDFSFAGVLTHDFTTGDNRGEAAAVFRI